MTCEDQYDTGNETCCVGYVTRQTKVILSENVCPSNGTTIYSPNLRVDDIVMTVNTTADGTLVVQERIDEPLYTVAQSILLTTENDVLLFCNDLEWKQYNTTDFGLASVPTLSLSIVLVSLLLFV
ncbi:hypothetical protein WA538_000799, partial [Blastocystis sp. DL]